MTAFIDRVSKDVAERNRQLQDNTVISFGCVEFQSLSLPVLEHSNHHPLSRFLYQLYEKCVCRDASFNTAQEKILSIRAAAYPYAPSGGGLKEYIRIMQRTDL